MARASKKMMCKYTREQRARLKALNEARALRELKRKAKKKSEKYKARRAREAASVKVKPKTKVATGDSESLYLPSHNNSDELYVLSGMKQLEAGSSVVLGSFNPFRLSAQTSQLQDLGKQEDFESLLEQKRRISERVTRPKIDNCSCLQSQCSKRYCECFKANSSCTYACKCRDCENQFGKRPSLDVAPGYDRSITCICIRSNCNRKYCRCFKFSQTCSKGCTCFNCENVVKKEVVKKEVARTPSKRKRSKPKKEESESEWRMSK